jgi:hypothetical protein
MSCQHASLLTSDVNIALIHLYPSLLLGIIRRETSVNVNTNVRDFVTVAPLEPNPVPQKACNRRVTKKIFCEKVGYIAR